MQTKQVFPELIILLGGDNVKKLIRHYPGRNIKVPTVAELKRYALLMSFIMEIEQGCPCEKFVADQKINKHTYKWLKSKHKLWCTYVTRHNLSVPLVLLKNSTEAIKQMSACLYKE
jgi:hypothetical protein